MRSLTCQLPIEYLSRLEADLSLDDELKTTTGLLVQAVVRYVCHRLYDAYDQGTY